MVPYPTTRSDVFMREFNMSLSVSKKAQKNLGYSKHPIGSTILMQIMMQLLLDSNDMT